MIRNIRNECNQTMVELSDLDVENHRTFPKLMDESFTTEKNKVKGDITVSKMKNKEILKKIIIKKDIQNRNVKIVKRKAQEDLEICHNKKRKLVRSISLFSNSNTEKLQKNKKENVTINNTIEDILIDTRLNSSVTRCTNWTDVDYISEINNVPEHIAENIVKLFESDNTIPFIARYRKNMTGCMKPDELRVLKASFDKVKIIKHRAAIIIKAINKLGKLTPNIHSAITSIKSLTDLEHIYSLFKSTTKRSLAEKARELGLANVSNAVLHGQKILLFSSLINEQKEGLQSEEQVRNGIVHIIADIISKDKKIFDKVISLLKTTVVEIQTTQRKIRDSNDKSKKTSNEQKYEIYFNFRTNEKDIKPHHILAINRAEMQKILSVKIIIPNVFEQEFKKYCLWKYALAAKATKLHLDFLNASIDYAYKKLIKPLVIRRVRLEMKERAETASIEVFATNVKQLLLVPPVRGKIILGIDPGFHHGCKLAVVSEYGNVLETAVIFPHKDSKKCYEHSVNVLIKLINEYKCTRLALGNGTACRETERFLTNMIKSKAFDFLDVTYTIVDEAGVSIYSCSPEAKSEFPNLDPNIISAISIARRLQDPLAELVKVEPKHLGVGMYQHDLPEKQLLNALDEVITETVSFVGVDINTTSKCLLRRVAGLTNSKAANIIEWRTKQGAFKNRRQLLNVKGIGSKTFEQCAGFIKILPETAIASGSSTKNKKSESSENIFNPLDQTLIHPESYTTVNKLLKYCQCNLNDINTSAFIERINLYAKVGYAKLAALFATNEATMKVIIKGLTMKKNEDIRLKSKFPLFRKNMRNIDDLSIGIVLNGVVRNVTHFGAFIDIGVGRDGLIHIKYLKNQILQVSQRVKVKVLSIERIRNRISLELIDICM